MPDKPNKIVENIRKDMIALYEIMEKSDFSEKDKEKFSRLVDEYNNYVSTILQSETDAIEEVEPAYKGACSLEAGITKSVSVL